MGRDGGTDTRAITEKDWKDTKDESYGQGESYLPNPRLLFRVMGLQGKRE